MGPAPAVPRTNLFALKRYREKVRSVRMNPTMWWVLVPPNNRAACLPLRDRQAALAEGVGLEPTRPLLNGLRFSKPLPYQFGATLRRVDNTYGSGNRRTMPDVIILEGHETTISNYPSAPESLVKKWIGPSRSLLLVLF